MGPHRKKQPLSNLYSKHPWNPFSQGKTRSLSPTKIIIIINLEPKNPFRIEDSFLIKFENFSLKKNPITENLTHIGDRF